MVDAGAIPSLVLMLDSPSENIQEQVGDEGEGGGREGRRWGKERREWREE